MMDNPKNCLGWRLAWLAILALPTAAGAEVVPRLPLQRGFYVNAQATCQTASNATLILVTKDGMNVSRIISRFRKIDKIGPTTYRVTEVPEDLSGQAGSPVTNTYEVPNATTFRLKNPAGAFEFRFCPQTSLPSPWRNNDIRSLIQ
jgi:hypothetical protein